MNRFARESAHLRVEEQRVHAPGEGTVCCALLRVRISDMSVVRTADVQVLVGRGVGKLATVLSPEVIVVCLVVLLELVCPDSTDTNCEVRVSRRSSGSIHHHSRTSGEADEVTMPIA